MIHVVTRYSWVWCIYVVVAVVKCMTQVFLILSPICYGLYIRSIWMKVWFHNLGWCIKYLENILLLDVQNVWERYCSRYSRRNIAYSEVWNRDKYSVFREKIQCCMPSFCAIYSKFCWRLRGSYNASYFVLSLERNDFLVLTSAVSHG